jgi:hypothetical protein
VSDYLAVGGVSAVLQSMLTSALTTDGPSSLLGSSSPGVTAVSPDLITTGRDEQPQLNLFMYYVSLNPALRNLDLPSMNGQGNQISNPPLAVNLHYLATAYGAKQFGPEILLAWTMKVFHDTPVVPATTIQSALSGLSGQSSAEAQLISHSTLAEQIEHLRITPETLTTEEIYRLWTAFQTAYRPSTAFQVSVVVIQSTGQFASNQLVQSVSLTAQPSQPPAIATISPSVATAGQQITITGSNFLGDDPSDTLVAFDSAPGVAPDTVSGDVVRVTLPASLQAGTRAVRVQRQVVFPSSPTPHAGLSSSPAALQLVPTIAGTSPIAATQNTSLTLTITPAVGQAQQVTIYVGDIAIPIDQRPVTGPASSTTVAFTVPGSVPAGLYPLRIAVDGAQSQLAPLAGGGFAPQVQVSA